MLRVCILLTLTTFARLQAMKDYQASYVSEEDETLMPVGLDAGSLQQLTDMAAAQGKSVTHLANELLKKSLV